jgi:4-carboxymuconolactone decarboxylase
MKQNVITLVALVLAYSMPASAQDASRIVITRATSRPSRVAPAENFTGTVRVQPLFGSSDGAGRSRKSVRATWWRYRRT